jgi:hypothetical protein
MPSLKELRVTGPGGRLGATREIAKLEKRLEGFPVFTSIRISYTLEGFRIHASHLTFRFKSYNSISWHSAGGVNLLVGLSNSGNRGRRVSEHVT